MPVGFLAFVIVVGVAGLPGCTDGNAGIPIGAPAEVLRRAPERTEREAGRIVIASDLAEYSGVIDFEASSGEVWPVVERGASRGDPIALRGDVVADDGDVLRGPTSTNPFLAVRLVRGATNVRPFGGRQVRGGSALQYRVEIETDRALANTPTAERPALREAFAAAKAARSFTADVFVDARGRITRIDLPRDLRYPATKNRRGFVATTTIELIWPA
ncbi:MAG TPA: hypothetical protein VMY34_03070 [Acidimicrobiales bacterium]|nr:hypothetical protein [Acidimicrobiales bacterium]